MKNYLIIGVLTVLFGLFSFQNASTCKKEELEALKNQSLSGIGKFKFLQSFEIKKDHFKYGGEKMEYRHFFSKGNDYLIILEDQGTKEDKMYVELYDNHKRMVATSYDKSKKKFYGKILFPCKSTETYFLKFGFVSGKPSCGASVIGFQAHPLKK